MSEETYPTDSVVSVEEEKYTRAELREACFKLYGVQPEVFDGALHNRHEQGFTRLEVEILIRDFLDAPIE